MIINMTTIAVRTHQYIDQTLESLFRSDGGHLRVNLILGSSDSSHVEKYRDRANIVPWDAEWEAKARPGQMRHNCNLNALRALRYGDDDHCLCCEDDIRFKEDWYSQLMLTIAEIGDHDYVLNLGQGCDQSPDKRYAVHTRKHLIGAQAIFYPNKALRAAVSDYLDSAVEDFLNRSVLRGTNDDLIGRYAKQYAALYNTTPPLVGHIGQVSSFSSQPKMPKPGPAPRPVASPAPQPVPRPAEKRAASVAFKEDLSRPPAEALLDILRRSLGGGLAPSPARLGEAGWRRVVQLATDHELTPIVHRTLEAGGADIPEECRRRLKASYVSNVFHAQLMQKSVDEIAAAFANDGIPLTLLNETALQRHLYEDPALRLVRSIDVLVDEADVERASSRLQRLGWTPVEPLPRRPLSLFHRPHRSAVPGTFPVNLHWRPFEPYLPYVFDREALRKAARPLGANQANVLGMAPEHELVLLCVRLDRRAIVVRSLAQQSDLVAWLLFGNHGVPLVLLYDIALYLRKRGASINWDELLGTARRWAVAGNVGATLELVQRVLGAEAPAEVVRGLQRERPRWIERIAHEAVLAAHDASGAGWDGTAAGDRARHLARLSPHVLRVARAWLALFPQRAYLDATYGDATIPLVARARHLKDLLPELWTETRDRLVSTVTARAPRT